MSTAFWDGSSPWDAAIPWDATSSAVPVAAPRRPYSLQIVHLSIGSGTRYFSDSEYGDPDGDGIPRRWYTARIVGDVQFRRATSTPFWGSGSDNAIGTIDLANADGALDNLAIDDVDGAIVSLYRVRSDHGIESAVLLATAAVARIEPLGRTVLRITTRDMATLLDVPIHRALYPDTAPEALRGQPRPLCIGSPLSVPAVLSDAVDYIYDVHDSDDFTLLRVREGGVVMTPTTDYVQATYGFELLDIPQSLIVADVTAGATTTTEVIGAALGDFDTDLTGWTVSTSGGGSVTWNAGEVDFATPAGGTASMVVASAVVELGRYDWSVVVSGLTGSLQVVAAGAVVAVITADGSYEGDFVATADGSFGFEFVGESEISDRPEPMAATIDTVRLDRIASAGNAAAALQTIVGRAGLAPDTLDFGSLIRLRNNRPWPMSLWEQSGRTAREALDDICRSVLGGSWTTATGRIAVSYLQNPAALTPTLTIQRWRITTEIDIQRDEAPGLTDVVRGARNWQPYTEDQLLDAVSVDDRGALTADYRISRRATGGVSAELGPRDGAERGLETLLDDAADVQECADIIGQLYPPTGRPRFLAFRAVLTDAEIASLSPLQTVVSVDVDRYGISDTPWLLVSVDGSGRSRECALRLWANTEYGT